MEKKTTVTKKVTYKRKDGTVVTKVYTYDKKTKEFYERKTRTKRPIRITTSTGKIVKKNYEKFLGSLEGSDVFEAKAIIRTYQKQGKLLTETKLQYEINKQQILSVLDTAGLSIEQICNKIGCTREQLLDLSNWNQVTTPKGKTRVGSIFTNPSNGKQYKFDVNYNGTAVLVQVNVIN